jgi:EAL domain-containing protein (putative c-di-GMP-specific phosphodiesterase class I)
VVVGASIGIAIALEDGASADELMKNAALALRRGKELGRGACFFYEKALNAHMQARRRLEADLRGALAAGELELYFQPIIDLESLEVSRAEALLRWFHGERGMIPPTEFIPVAEDTGLIVPLGAWAIEQACTAAASWPERVSVAVNLSPVQFERPGLVEAVAGALAASGLRASRLELEITESVLLQDNARNLAVLDQLGELGVSIALDDFGTGYSSLSYLQRFAFDRIKIDHSFIRSINRNAGSLKIVRSIVTLAHSLGLMVTAEGVETDEQFAAVRGEGCDDVQGYYIGRPQPLETFKRSLTGVFRAGSVAGAAH